MGKKQRKESGLRGGALRRQRKAEGVKSLSRYAERHAAKLAARAAALTLKHAAE